MRLFLIPALLVAFHAPAQEDVPLDQTGPASQAQLRRVLEFMQSHDEDRRRSAYQASRDRGDEFRDTYLKLIESAIKHHAGGFERVIERELGPRSARKGLREAWDTWQEQATSARQHIQTDHAKARDRLDEMDQLFASAARSWQALQSAFPAPADHEALIDSLEAHATALRELAHELNPGEISPTDVIDLPTIERELGLGPVLRDYLAVHEVAAMFMDKHRQTNETNQQMSWADKDQKTFAAILNQRRATVGLDPLTLNENLSAACAAHSVEMERLGYFAHESPVEENRTPLMRARKAGFDRFAGECIFMGRIAATDAEQAWWYSCGHRLINYGSGVGILGIARHNLYWTLNTGR